MKNLKSNKNNNDPVAVVIVVELVGSFQPKKLIFFFLRYTYCLELVLPIVKLKHFMVLKKEVY